MICCKEQGQVWLRVVVVSLLRFEGQRGAFLQHNLRARRGSVCGAEIKAFTELVAVEDGVLDVQMPRVPELAKVRGKQRLCPDERLVPVFWVGAVCGSD